MTIPDITSSQLLEGQPPGLLSMCAGDFVEVLVPPSFSSGGMPPILLRWCDPSLLTCKILREGLLLIRDKQNCDKCIRYNMYLHVFAVPSRGKVPVMGGNGGCLCKSELLFAAQVYSGPQHAGTYDCVATCFFIDTAHNIIEYLQVIHHVLKVTAACPHMHGPIVHGVSLLTYWYACVDGAERVYVCDPSQAQTWV